MTRAALLFALSLVLVTPAFADAFTDMAAAQKAMQGRDYGRAIRLYSSALADKELPTPQHIAALTGRGAAYIGNNQGEKAVVDYSDAIRLKPDCGTCYNNRGMAFNGAGDYDRAIADFNLALKYEPNSWEVYFNRAIAWYHKDDNDHAIADYTAAIKLKPDCGPCFHNRGMAWQDKGDMGRANEDLNTADQMKH